MIILWVILGIICYLGVIYLHLLLFKQVCLNDKRKSTIENILDEMDDVAIIMWIPVMQVLSLIITSIIILYNKIKHFEL